MPKPDETAALAPSLCCCCSSLPPDFLHRHRNVVSFIGAVTEQPNLCVITEYMARGSMHDLLHKVGLRPDTEWLLKIASDVAHGVKYLHGCKPPIIHRDLKSQNILVDGQWTAKIADFGLSRFFQVTRLVLAVLRCDPLLRPMSSRKVCV